jgi:hypothetical protein
MIKYLYNLYYRRYPPEMVGWWKEKEACRAKVTEADDGSYIMWMEGEKYPFPGYPRGHLLYGSLSPLKHNIKVKLFNEAWEVRDDQQAVLQHYQETLPTIYALGHEVRHDMMPLEKMCPAVREIHRAMTVAGCPPELRDILCFIFQEDDAYRFRFQWLVGHMNKRDLKGSFDKGMKLMEHAEVVNDMKERVNLVRTILLLVWNYQFGAFFKELDFKKVRLSRADKYFFRAKYFKVDYPLYEY